MSRPPLDLGTHGEITLTAMPTGKVRARTRYRDYDGKVRLIERHGASNAAATRTLKAAIKDRQTPATGQLNRDTRITTLVELWWVDFLERDTAQATVRRYREVTDAYIVPKLGAVRLGEVTVGLLDHTLRSIKEKHGAASAKLCQTVLRQMFSLAARRDALPVNPMASVDPVKVARRAVKTLSATQVQEMRGLLPHGDAVDVLDLLLATGARIGEVLAIRWEDVELDSDKPRLTISGTVVRGTDKKIHRQPHPKSKGSQHRLFLPAFGADVFHRRHRWSDLVFPNTTGGPVDPSNLRRKWRESLKGTDYGDVYPHMIRATVATHIARATSLEAAAAQLGHASETVTMKHYVEKLADAPDASQTLEDFLGK